MQTRIRRRSEHRVGAGEIQLQDVGKNEKSYIQAHGRLAL
jgi:hypothetical protein